MSALRFAYYPGCSQTGTSIEYDQSTRACCKALGLELRETPDWSCCGSTPAHVVDHALAAALAGRNLVQAAKTGAERLLTPCPSCLLALRAAQGRCRDEQFRAKAEALLGAPMPMEMRASSVLQALVEELGIERIAQAATRPLAGLTVAAYYGCLLTRPPGLMAFEDPENPTCLERLFVALGARAAAFPLKTECCGAALAVPRKDAVLELSGKILESAEASGANAIVVACPLCQMNLDLRREQIEAHWGRRFALPVFYFTQLLGLALGLDAQRLGLDRLNVSASPTLELLRRAWAGKK
jgi:heterodisulfide reductase subunit B